MGYQPAPRETPVSLLTPERPVVIIGAGPAGLTAGYELTRRGVPTVILDQDAQVGGLARTVVYRGFRFDIGGHRFFTKVTPVRTLWREMLGLDLLKRPRLSRILYAGRFFDYPLKPLNVVANLGLGSTIAAIASYLVAKVRPVRPEVSFADWVTNRFGRRLYRLFFKCYTEKVWGIPCERIGAEWAAQRIKALSLRTVAINMLFPGINRGQSAIKTLIDEFEYPRLGPGMMWERFAEGIEKQSGLIRLRERVVRLTHQDVRIDTLLVETANGRREQPAGYLISTMPIPHLVRALDPPPPPDVIEAAHRLKHRDFLSIVLIIDKDDLFPDNWIYVHDESVRVGRIQNYKNWSPEMVPDARFTCLGLEYFVNEGDDLWTMGDADLIALGTQEVQTIGLASAESVVDGTVVRMPKAYPVYESGYIEALEVLKRYLARFENLQPIGRNGMHKYNNQDHSMLTAMLAVRNLFGADYDLWAVNADDEYHEGEQAATGGDEDLARYANQLAATQPLVPRDIGSRIDG
jgi:protoporphyrinogen oxidase